VTLTADLVSSKCIGVIHWVCPIVLHVQSTMTVTQKLFKLLSFMIFAFNASVTLTSDLVTSKSIGIIYWPWALFLPSTMTVNHKLSSYWANMVFGLSATVTLTSDLVTSKCIGVIHWVCPIVLHVQSTMTMQNPFKIIILWIFVMLLHRFACVFAHLTMCTWLPVQNGSATRRSLTQA